MRNVFCFFVLREEAWRGYFDNDFGSKACGLDQSENRLPGRSGLAGERMMRAFVSIRMCERVFVCASSSLGWLPCLLGRLGFVLLFGIVSGFSAELKWTSGPGFRSAELEVPKAGRPGFTLMDPGQTGLSFSNVVAQNAT